MSKRPMMNLAMLGLAVAFGPTFLAGCGSNESASTSPATKPVDLAALDENDPKSVAMLAKEFDVTIMPYQEPARTRSGPSDAPAFLMFPRGEVRKEGLGMYRVDLGESYRDDGVLQFLDGKKVLWKGDGAFNPTKPVTVSNIPKAVVDAVKAGDTITWGIFFDDKHKKAITTSFKVITKLQVTEKFKKMDASKSFQKQPKLLQSLVKAEALQAYSLDSEALSAFLDIVGTNKEMQQAHMGIVTVLRRMHLDDSPLFGEEMARIDPIKGGHRDGGPGLGEIAGKDVKKLNGNGATVPVKPTDGITPGTALGKRTEGDPVGPESTDPAVTTTSDPVLVPTTPGAPVKADDPELKLLTQKLADAQKASEAAGLQAQAAAAALADAKKVAEDKAQALIAAKAALEADPSNDDLKNALFAAEQAAKLAADDLVAKTQAADDAAAAAQAAQDFAKKAQDELALHVPPAGPVLAGQDPLGQPAANFLQNADTDIAKTEALLKGDGTDPKAKALVLALDVKGIADQKVIDAKAALDASPDDPALAQALLDATVAANAAKDAADAAAAAAGAANAGLVGPEMTTALNMLAAAKEADRQAKELAKTGGPAAVQAAQHAADLAAQAKKAMELAILAQK